MNIASLLQIKYPIIMAPMFLVSNEEMIIAALENGITAAFPALNYRTTQELIAAIQNIKSKTDKPFGINLIVNKSNPKYQEHLDIILNQKVAFVITSLGNPKETIEKCKPLGIKVFCDVTDLNYALKVQKLGADAVIAVNNIAGGHAGKLSPQELITTLKKEIHIPIISAGGITNANDINQVMELGASGVSVGTVFIASNECKVSDEYKNALVQYGAKDIILTSKLSGSPLTIINTPYFNSIKDKISILEWLLKKNKWLKKYLKLIIAVKGMRQIEKSAFKATYQTVWCAGPAIEHIHNIRPIKEIVKQLTDGLTIKSY